MTADLNSLRLFTIVARHRSFRRAAAELGSSASSLSERVRQLENRLGVRLLNRTTRSVAVTEAGQRLLDRILPALAVLDETADMMAAPAEALIGTLRINGPAPAVEFVLAPKLIAFLTLHPGVRAEVVAAEGFVDIVAGGFDAGVRYEESLDQDMIAVPLGSSQRFRVVGSPGYFLQHGRPAHPSELTAHRRLAHRFASGRIVPWEFERSGDVFTLMPDGPVTSNVSSVALAAARAGLGLVYLFDEYIRPDLERGTLEAVLDEWCPPFPGPYLYFPHRQLMPATLRAFVDFLKSTAGNT